MNPADRPGLSRARVVAAALEQVQRQGLDALTMRGLADELGVKAASLYWHVRDRAELVELIAQALLEETPPPLEGGGWRADAIAASGGLERIAGRRRDAGRILLQAPEAERRSAVHARLAARLEAAGLAAAEAADAATMTLLFVLFGAAGRGEPVPDPGRPVEIAIDSGSRGVTLRAGPPMSGLVALAHDPRAPAPALVRGDSVVVRRRRGAGQAELVLNPAHAWRFHVQAPTWNTVLDLRGPDVRGIHVDSGAARIRCILPEPRREVPIVVSGGVAGVVFARPPGAKLVAEISAGALRLRLDGRPIAATVFDSRWESQGTAAGGLYRLRIASGAVRVTVEEDAAIAASAVAEEESAAADGRPGLGLLLDGIAARLSAGQ